MKYSLITFSPSQAEEISGLSVAMQRDYRRRDLIAKGNETPARFDAFDLADMRILKLAADGGHGPTSGRLIKRVMAYCVVSRALLSPQGYRGLASDGEVEKVRAAILSDAMKRDDRYTGARVPPIMLKNILNPARFALLWGDDCSLGDSLDALHAGRFKDRQETLPGLYIDLHGAAVDLLRNAGELVTVGERGRG